MKLFPGRSLIVVLLALPLSSASLLFIGGLAAQRPAVPANAEARAPFMAMPPPPLVNEARRALGERLFADARLSGDGTRSCASCHDLASNGATAVPRDTAPDGRDLPLNTSTVFNAALSFRLNWEGGMRSLEAQAESLLRHPAIMDADIPVVIQRLTADPAMIGGFAQAYDRTPDLAALLDALATFQRTLITPDSRFDRWLEGDATAITGEEEAGFELFRSVGCTACHQGVNIGGNLFQRHGIFHPLVSPEPQRLRVPSLRNIATTAPYFHDGSVATLEDAVRGMGLAQLNLVFTQQEVVSIVAFLRTLTGSYRGTPLRAPP